MDLNAIDWSQVFTVTGIVIDYAIKIVAVGTVPQNRAPSSSTAWLLLILVIPVIGLPLYLLIGSPYLTGKRRQIQANANRVLASVAPPTPAYPRGFDCPRGLESIVTMNRRLTSMSMLTGRDRGLLPDTADSARQMAAAVDTATETVHVEFYIMAWDETTDPFFTALANAVRRGVKVRLLFDHLGTRGYPGYRELKKKLTAAGIEWHAMMPLLPLRGQWRRPDLRNHRKLLVIDDRVGFIGSMNMIDASYLRASNRRRHLQWLDLNLQVTGPIVGNLNQIFAVDWFTETDELIRDRDLASASAGEHEKQIPMQLVPSGPGFLTEPNLRVFVNLIHLAQRQLRIVSPYFVPDQSLLMAITTAAQRGVQVDLYVSEQADHFMVYHAQRSYYEELLLAGVRIHCYRKPVILHSKFLTVDEEISVIGSSNMDMRSFFLDFEISLLSVGSELVDELTGVINDYEANSFELELESWRARPRLARYVDNVMRLTSAVQ